MRSNGGEKERRKHAPNSGNKRVIPANMRLCEVLARYLNPTSYVRKELGGSASSVETAG